MVVVVFFKGSS